MSSIAVPALAPSRRAWLTDLPVLSLTTVQRGSAVAVFALLAAVPGTGQAPWTVAAGFGVREWGGMLFLSVFCTLFAFFVQMWSVRHLAVPGQSAARHGTAVGRRRGDRDRWRAARRTRRGGRGARPGRYRLGPPRGPPAAP